MSLKRLNKQLEEIESQLKYTSGKLPEELPNEDLVSYLDRIRKYGFKLEDLLEASWKKEPSETLKANQPSQDA